MVFLYTACQVARIGPEEEYRLESHTPTLKLTLEVATQTRVPQAALTATSTAEPTTHPTFDSLSPAPGEASEATGPAESTSTPTAIPSAEVVATSSEVLTPGERSDWLVFSSRRQDTNGDGVVNLRDGVHLFIVDPATGGLRQLTFGSQFDLDPSWAPDKRRIAFVSNRTGNFELFTIHPDGSQIAQLTHTPYAEGAPDWSPDGKQIAYTVDEAFTPGSPQRRLYVTSESGEETRQLTFGPADDSEPDWSIDSRVIAYTREELRREGQSTHFESGIGLLDVQTGSLFVIPQGELQPPNSAPVVAVDCARWVPLDEYILTVSQASEDSSIAAHLYRLRWSEGGVEINRLPIVIDFLDNCVTWGPRGDWLISTASYNAVDSSPEAYFQSLELIRVPIEFAWSSALPDTVNLSLITDAERLTENELYECCPDWVP
jgi:Tol biopolymer transport system component